MASMQLRVGFSTTEHWLSRVIRFFTKSSVSHCWLAYYDDELDVDFVLEASEFGFRMIPMEVFRKHNLVKEIVNTGRFLGPAGKTLFSWLGHRYDFTGLAGMSWTMVWRRLGFRARNPGNSKATLFCSEAVAAILRLSAYPGSETLVPDQTSPQDVYDFLKARP